MLRTKILILQILTLLYIIVSGFVPFQNEIQKFKYIDDYKVLLDYNENYFLKKVMKEIDAKATVETIEGKKYSIQPYRGDPHNVISYRHKITYKKLGIVLLTDPIYEDDDIDSASICYVEFSFSFNKTTKKGIKINSTKEEVLSKYSQNEINTKDNVITVIDNRIAYYFSEKNKKEVVTCIRVF